MAMNRRQKSVAFKVDDANRSSNSNLDDLRQESSSAVHRTMSECCYSISNLVLIIASVAAIAVLVQFIQDDPLYEYGEHLLTLRFYRQLIYMLVILPLVLLVPLFNATSAFCLSSNDHRYDQVSRSILTAKIFFQFLLLILVFVALVLIGPSIRTSNIASQIELEIRKHMRWRYENSFSYEFLDRLQEEYECCDELWYRANMNDHLPSSCFVHGSNFGLIHDETCSEAIGSIVSLRCGIIGACLIIILVALACLLAIDIIELLTMTRRGYQQSYDFRANEAKFVGGTGAGAAAALDNDDSASQGSFASTSTRQNQTARSNNECANYLKANQRALANRTIDLEHEELPSAGTQNRLRSSERKRDLPLLVDDNHRPASDDDDEEARRPSSRASGSSDRLDQSPGRSRPATILTRATYNQIERDRSQSPLFLGSTIERQTASTSTTCSAPIKSALKKTPSGQRLESSSSSTSNSLLDVDGALRDQLRGSPVEADADSLLDYAEKLRTNSASLIRRQQEQQKEIQLHQTRRSLLNVRFADQ